MLERLSSLTSTRMSHHTTSLILHRLSLARKPRENFHTCWSNARKTTLLWVNQKISKDSSINLRELRTTREKLSTFFWKKSKETSLNKKPLFKSKTEEWRMLSPPLTTWKTALQFWRLPRTWFHLFKDNLESKWPMMSRWAEASTEVMTRWLLWTQISKSQSTFNTSLVLSTNLK